MHMHSQMHNLFHIPEDDGWIALPADQMPYALAVPEHRRGNIFVAGKVDLEARVVHLVRGNGQQVTADLGLFHPSGTSLKPDFDKFRLDDGGYAVCFGEYEAAADVVLWELDPEYRKERKQREREVQPGIGGSIRRLRLQRRLTQDDFPGVSRKTIQRIENGEIEKPQKRTLEIVAERLGVAAGDLETY